MVCTHRRRETWVGGGIGTRQIGLGYGHISHLSPTPVLSSLCGQQPKQCHQKAAVVSVLFSCSFLLLLPRANRNDARLANFRLSLVEKKKRAVLRISESHGPNQVMGIMYSWVRALLGYTHEYLPQPVHIPTIYTYKRRVMRYLPLNDVVV